MRRRSVEFDYWRHFVPFAPDIDIQVESGATSYHNLGREHMIQGAKDPETHESPSIDLNKVPTQRGWRMRFVPITLPVAGQVESTVDGFKYFVPKHYVGVDCFNYILTNGTQESNVARVMLDVVRGYTYNLNLIKQVALDQWVIQILGLEETELEQPEHQLFNWYVRRPTLVFNEKLQREQVEEERKLLDFYRLSGYQEDGKWHYTVKDNPTELTKQLETDIWLDGYPVGDTDVPYKPTGTLGNIEIEATLFFGEILNSPSRKVIMDIGYIYGERWWESGNIQEG